VNESTHRSDLTHCPGCGDAEGAWSWVELVAEVALEGDDDALETLGSVIAHWLEVQRWERAS
jgi:hypothetical protein